MLTRLAIQNFVQCCEEKRHYMKAVDAKHATEVLANADCLYDTHAVEQAFDRMAQEINQELADKNPLLLCVLTGGIVTAGYLLPRLNFPLELDYIHATRYRGELSGGDALHWLARPRTSLDGRVVLIVDDILDEGYTLAGILKECHTLGAAQIYSAALVRKLHARCVPDLEVDFIGLEVEDRYVFGYGMDYKEYLRNAPGIYAVKGS